MLRRRRERQHDVAVDLECLAVLQRRLCTARPPRCRDSRLLMAGRATLGPRPAS